MTVDLGAGDGRAAYRLARAEPERLVVAVDANADAMRPLASRAARAVRKGGAPNLVLVHADLASLAEPFLGRADAVTVTLPWAGLLAAATAHDRDGLARIRAVCRAGASLRVVVSHDPARDLGTTVPGLDAAWIDGPIRARYTAAGFDDPTITPLTMADLRNVGTRWAKRLAFGPPRPTWRIEAVALPAGSRRR